MSSEVEIDRENAYFPITVHLPLSPMRIGLTEVRQPGTVVCLSYDQALALHRALGEAVHVLRQRAGTTLGLPEPR